MILINGVPGALIPATDRGLAYGDGVFRTLCAWRGEPLHWARHYSKLLHDCEALALPCPEAALLQNEVRAVARSQETCAIRITLTRGSGPRGYAPPPSSQPLRIVSGAEYAVPGVQSEGICVHLCRLRLGSQPSLAGVKHLNRLENVLARAEWTDPAAAEGLLLDQDGVAVGGTMSNVFIVEAGTLVTPSLHQCGVAGVTRDRVMAASARLNISCRTESVPLKRLLDAEEVFFVNSLIGLWPVARLGERVWRRGSVSQNIKCALEAEDAEVV